jgi:hypothetical protein
MSFTSRLSSPSACQPRPSPRSCATTASCLLTCDLALACACLQCLHLRQYVSGVMGDGRSLGRGRRGGVGRPVSQAAILGAAAIVSCHDVVRRHHHKLVGVGQLVRADGIEHHLPRHQPPVTATPALQPDSRTKRREETAGVAEHETGTLTRRRVSCWGGGGERVRSGNLLGKLVGFAANQDRDIVLPRHHRHHARPHPRDHITVC